MMGINIENIDEIKEILYNYNLLDDYFIDEDVPTSVGEIYQDPIDAKISINTKGNKEMAKQLMLLQTAVDKIWRGYMAAFNKESYKKQFDLYPLRDFEEHMASLGAERNGIDFAPAEDSEKIDWIAKVNSELKKRVAEYKKKQKEAAIKKKLEEKDAEILKKRKEKEDKKNKIKDIKNKDKQRQNVPEYLGGEGDAPPVKSQIEELTYAEETANLKKQKEATDDIVETYVDPVTGKVTSPRETEYEKTKKKIEKKQEWAKGETIKDEQQKKIMSALTSAYDKEASKLDGFTTKGPFCLQKRKYFRDIFRPSISHIDTEFREATQTKRKAKDEQTSKTIKPIKFSLGTGPKKPLTTSESLDQQLNQSNLASFVSRLNLGSEWARLTDEQKGMILELEKRVTEFYTYLSTINIKELKENLPDIDGFIHIMFWGLISMQQGSLDSEELKKVIYLANHLGPPLTEIQISTIQKHLRVINNAADIINANIRQYTANQQNPWK